MRNNRLFRALLFPACCLVAAAVAFPALAAATGSPRPAPHPAAHPGTAAAAGAAKQSATERAVVMAGFDKSPTGVIVETSLKGQSRTYKFTSLGAYWKAKQRWPQTTTISKVQMLDYNSFGGRALSWLACDNAYFVFGAKDIKNSGAPYVAAFADRTAAEKAQAKLGGEVLNWSDVQSRLAKQATAPAKPGFKHPVAKTTH